MLKPADCKPGTEVIAIKNYPYMMPALVIGNIYTLEELVKERFELICDWNQIVIGPFVKVHEAESRICRKCSQEVIVIYFLDQFKLRDVEGFEKLFNLRTVKVPEPV